MNDKEMTTEEFEAGLRTLTPEQLQEVQREFDLAEGIDADSLNELEVKSEMKRLTKPQPILSGRQEHFLTELIKAKANPEKALAWIKQNENAAIDYEDTSAELVVQNQRLKPDKFYSEIATKKVKDSYLNNLISREQLPLDLIEKLYHLPDKQSAIGSLASYRKQVADSIKDEANAYLLAQSQDQFLPIVLRRKIAGISARNLGEAKLKTASAITNWKQRQ